MAAWSPERRTVGHRQTFDLRRTGVVRKIEQSGAEAVPFDRIRPLDDPGNLARDRFDQEHRRQLAPRNDEIADRNLLVHDGLAHALVDPLVAPAEQEQIAPARELAHFGLVQPVPLGRQQHPPGSSALRELPHRSEPRGRGHHHAAATAEGLVVDRAVAVEGEIPQVVHLHVQAAALAGAPEKRGLEKGPKELGEDGQDLNAHVASSPSGSRRSMRRASRSTRTRKASTKGITDRRPSFSTSSRVPPPSS